MLDIKRKSFEKRFWYYANQSQLRPQGIATIEEYAGGDYLHITTLDAKEQKRWIKEFPSLTNVKVLWVYSNVNKQLFESICQMPSLVGVYFMRITATDLDSLRKLKNLKYLSLGGATKIGSIETLRMLDKLKALTIENAKKISDFSSLESLTNLEELNVSGSMWTAQNIDNFEFIAKLTNIKYLSFVNTRAEVKNFDPLLNLKKLESFHSSFNYPQEEFEKLQILPNLKFSNIPYVLKSEDNLDQLYKSFGI